MAAWETEVEREIWKASGFMLRSKGDIALPGEAADLACLKLTLTGQDVIFYILFIYIFLYEILHNYFTEN